MSDNVDALKARIEALEQQNAACIATLEESAIRIEALEAALREIAHGEDFEHETIGIALEHARSTAQTALAPEQDK